MKKTTVLVSSTIVAALCLVDVQACGAATLDEDLIKAAGKGDLAKVRQLLAKGANVNAAGKSGWSVLFDAVGSGKAPVIEALLQAGANVNQSADTGITVDTRSPEPDLAAMVGMLLEKGGDPNVRAEGGLSLLAIGNSGKLSLLVSCKKLGAADATKVCDKESITPLMVACARGNFAVAQALIKAGADVNAKSGPGYSALLLSLARLKQVKDGTQVKIDEVVPKSLRDGGATALMLAAALDREDVVQSLLARGADFRATDNKGRTALSIARENNGSAVEKILLNSGAKE